MRQKAERKARDEANDAAFERYLIEGWKKDIEKQREDDKARHARSKLVFTLYSNIYVILYYSCHRPKCTCLVDSENAGNEN